MKYKIVKETKPTLKNYERYKAVAQHYQTVTTEQLRQEIQDNCSAKKSDVLLVLTELTEVLVRHLKEGDRVRIDGLGLLKLEIESEKVDTPEEFNVHKHVRSLRVHLLPESHKGEQLLYKDIRLERTRD